MNQTDPISDALIRRPWSLIVLGAVVAIPFCFPAWSDAYVLGRWEWIERRGIIEFWDTMLTCYTWPMTVLVALINPFNLRIQYKPWRSALVYAVCVALVASLLFILIPTVDSAIRDRDPLFLKPAAHILQPNLNGFVIRTLLLFVFPLMMTGCGLWVRADLRQAFR